MLRLKNFARNQKGGAAILFAISATVVIGFGAMAVDVGNFFYEKRKLQTANDLAALAAASDLPRAVREVAAGRAWLHPQAQRQMLDWMRRPPSGIDALTARERTVLLLLAEGLSNKLIARRLDLTEGTVKGYVSQVLDKLGVSDRTQAALLAHREGLGAPG